MGQRAKRLRSWYASPGSLVQKPTLLTTGPVGSYGFSGLECQAEEFGICTGYND